MRTDLTPEALAALDAKAAAATPGPWDWTITTDRHWSYVQADDGSGDLYTVAGAISDDDNAAFLAAADPSTVRALIAALTEARAEVERLAEQKGIDDRGFDPLRRMHVRVMNERDEAQGEAAEAIRLLDAAEARLAAVRALHFSDGSDSDWCLGCSYSHPCPTVRALDGAS